MKGIAYLAHPIDLSTMSQAWRARVVQEQARLAADGWAVFTPSRAWLVPGGPIRGVAGGSPVQDINMQIVGQSGLVSVVLPPNCPSIGVWLEVEYARSLGVPVRILASPEMVQRSHALSWLGGQDGVMIHAAE